MTQHPIPIHTGKQLRLRRTMLGLSQEDVGNGIGVASQQIQKYEKGSNVMSAVRLWEFAQLLNVPIAYFYEGFESDDSLARAKQPSGFAEEQAEFQGEFKAVTDRETLEMLKSFKRIKDHALRKRIADMLRTLSLKNV